MAKKVLLEGFMEIDYIVLHSDDNLIISKIDGKKNEVGKFMTRKEIGMVQG